MNLGKSTNHPSTPGNLNRLFLVRAGNSWHVNERGKIGLRWNVPTIQRSLFHPRWLGPFREYLSGCFGARDGHARNPGRYHLPESGSSQEKNDASFPASNQGYALKKEVPMSALSFAADIRPLFRSYDIESMKPAGIDLSSYEDVKKKAQSIYARLSAKDMPCDGSWSDQSIQKFKEWMESGMKP